MPSLRRNTDPGRLQYIIVHTLHEDDNKDNNNKEWLKIIQLSLLDFCVWICTSLEYYSHFQWPLQQERFPAIPTWSSVVQKNKCFDEVTHIQCSTYKFHPEGGNSMFWNVRTYLYCMVWKKQPPFFQKLETYLSSYQLHLNSVQVITGWKFREMALLISNTERVMDSLIC